MSTPGQSSILGSPIIYAKVDYGPTLGFVYRPVNNRRLVTAAGDDTVQPFDQMVLYNKTIPATFQVFLPDLDLWMTKPYGGFDLIFIDSGSNATIYPITFVPFGSQTIEGTAGNFIMDTDGGSTIFIPATDKSGWTLIQETPGSGGGGGGDMLRTNNLSDVINVATSRTNLGVTATGLDTTYLYRANNLSDVASAATSRTNLGVLAIANNLSDVASAATSRANLGVAIGSIDVVIDGAGATLTTGLKGYLPPAPFAMTLNQATLTANASGSVVVNIWKCTYAQFDSGATHPVVGDKITASAPPTISAATKSQDSTLTGWTTSIAAGDILAFNIDSVTTIQQVGLSLKYTKA